MLKSFLEYSKIFEKVEFKEKFLREIEKRVEKSDKIAKYLINYVKNNDDDYFDWVEIADLFASNKLIITSKNNKPQVMKMTRFLRKILPQNLFSSDEIDKFVFNILANNIDDTYFEIWNGEKIREAFSPDNFLIKEGDLINSCMSSNKCLPFFDLYTTNKNIKMLVLLHENKIIARAIIWDAFYIDGKKYQLMDNIYSINENERKKMLEYANDNDILFYSEIGKQFKDKFNKSYPNEFIVKLENVDFDYYPYVDTLSYLDKDKKQLSNKKGVYLLQNEKGNLPACIVCQDEHQLLCSDCGGTGTINGENCKSCDGTSFISCPNCSE